MRMSSRGMPRLQVLSAVALLGLLASGCAKPPTVEIEAADAAMGNAMNAEAQEYAPEAMGPIRDLRAQLDAELALQGEKWAVTRSYDRAIELASQIEVAAKETATEAAQAKETVRNETTVLLAEVKVVLEEVQALLAKAPTGKGSAADLAALKADLDSAALILGESEADLVGGKYLEAKTKLLSVQSGVEGVRAAIDAAVLARRTGS